MSDSNQYQTPASNVEQAASTEYGDVIWHAASGRLGRIRYIAYSMGLGLASMVLMGILVGIFFGGAALFSSGEAIFGDGDMGLGMGIGLGVMGLVLLGIYIATIILTVRMMIQRLHDFNVSGWLCLIYLVPFVSLIFMLFLIFTPGTNGENKFGLKTPPNGAATVVVIIIALTIPVIGILSAIAIPAYQGYVDQARQMQQLEQRQ